MPNVKVITKTTEQTRSLGKKTAKSLLKKELPHALCVCLFGDLGAGKTTFAQGFALGLGIKEKVNSPTFVILKRFANFYHIDAYRLKTAKDAEALGLKEILATPKNIVLIEWPEAIKSMLPKKRIDIYFKHEKACHKRGIVFYSKI